MNEADRLLIGDAISPAQPKAAIASYTQAAATGSGAAATRLAVLAAMGVTQAPNWSQALDWLV